MKTNEITPRVLFISILIGFIPILLIWLLLLLIIGSESGTPLLTRLDILIPCLIFGVWRTWVAHKRLLKIIGESKYGFFKTIEKYYSKDG